MRDGQVFDIYHDKEAKHYIQNHGYILYRSVKWKHIPIS